MQSIITISAHSGLSARLVNDVSALDDVRVTPERIDCGDDVVGDCEAAHRLGSDPGNHDLAVFLHAGGDEAVVGYLDVLGVRHPDAVPLRSVCDVTPDQNIGVLDAGFVAKKDELSASSSPALVAIVGDGEVVGGRRRVFSPELDAVGMIGVGYIGVIAVAMIAVDRHPGRPTAPDRVVPQVVEGVSADLEVGVVQVGKRAVEVREVRISHGDVV